MTATAIDVARKDFEDAIRSRVLWGLTATFVAFLVMALLTAEELVQHVERVDAIVALTGVAMLAQLFIPGVAIVGGYMALTGERESGSLRVLLSFPFSRGDVIAGKLFGRLALTLTALAVGFVVAAAIVAVRYGLPSATTFGLFVAAAALLGAVFTALAVGGSAIAWTRGRAMALTIGPFVAMVFFWKPVVVGLHYAVNRTLPGVEVEAWYLFVKRLNPLEAYRVVVGAILDEPVQAVPHLPLEDLPVGTVPQAIDTATRLGGDVPWYLSEEAAVGILVLWGLVPIAIGYRRFTASDVG
ncbi:MAG: ABC transporter permease subunit [Halobacteriota archaeon]